MASDASSGPTVRAVTSTSSPSVFSLSWSACSTAYSSSSESRPGTPARSTVLSDSITPAAIQLQVFGIPTTTGSGDIEVLPQGGTFGSTASLVYLGNNAFTSSAVTSFVNLANKQISVQVRGGGAHVAIDVVGYFRAPAGGFVSSVTAGAGLTGGTITTSGTIAVDTTAIQSRVTGTCASGSSIRTINANGSVTCQTDGPVNAFVQNGNAFGADAVLGTTDGSALDLRAGGARVMRYEPNAISPNVIGGSPANNVTPLVRGATIAGGGVPSGNTDPTFPSEAPNRVTDAYGTVGGGFANVAGDDAGTVVDHPFATVAGGVGNVASGTNATVAGGFGNVASGTDSVVAGGSSNVASGTDSTIAGGILNIASGTDSSVGGGAANEARGLDSFVAGGVGNLASGHASWAGGAMRTPSPRAFPPITTVRSSGATISVSFSIPWPRGNSPRAPRAGFASSPPSTERVLRPTSFR